MFTHIFTYVIIHAEENVHDCCGNLSRNKADGTCFDITEVRHSVLKVAGF
jgi:hypothetical protein